jgi:hypothetical protein
MHGLVLVFFCKALEISCWQGNAGLCAHVDWNGDLHTVLHWERLCEIRPESAALPASDFPSDQAENFGALRHPLCSIPVAEPVDMT